MFNLTSRTWNCFSSLIVCYRFFIVIMFFIKVFNQKLLSLVKVP
jgi:hypothetical protein